MAKKGNINEKAKVNNSRNYDVMNPEATDPNVKNATKQLGKISLKIIKELAKQALKLIQKLINLLINAGPFGIVLLVLLIVVIIIVCFQHMPGMMQEKLIEFFSINDASFINGAVADLDKNYDDINNVANYLEEMGYNLVGDGFVRPLIRTSMEYDTFTVKEILEKNEGYKYELGEDSSYHFYDADDKIVENLEYYDNIGQKIDNVTGKLVTNGETYIDEFGIERSTEDNNGSRGKVKINPPTNENVYNEEVKDLRNYRLLRTYLLSNYRIYNLKNNDENIIKNIASSLRRITGGDSDGWAKGLIKLYNAENGIASSHWWWGKRVLGDVVEINDKTLKLKRGWLNSEMNFSIEGWAPRYGMSLEFLLSLHLGTGAPDLVYAMLQNFDTEVQVYLDDAGTASVTASYVDPKAGDITPDEGATLDKIQNIMIDVGNGTYHKEDYSWFDRMEHHIYGIRTEVSERIGQLLGKGAKGLFYNWTLSRRVCQILLTYGKRDGDENNENVQKNNLHLVCPDNCLGTVSENKGVYPEEEKISNEFNISNSEFKKYGIDVENTKVYDNFNADLKKQGLDSIEIKDFKVDGNEYYNGPEPSQWPNSEDTRKKYGFYEDETYKEDDEHIKLAHEGEHFENNELGSEEIPERKIDVIGEILNDTSYEYVYNELKAEDETGEACSNFEREVSNFIEEFREQCKNKLWEDKTYHYEWEVADGEVNKKYWNEGGRRDMEINRRI